MGELVNRLGHSLLELVFDRSGADELEVGLDALRECLYTSKRTSPRPIGAEVSHN